MDSRDVGSPLLHLDLLVDERATEEGVLDLLSRIRPEWKTEDIQMKKFTEGITNQLIGCSVGSHLGSECVLVRLYGRMTELYVNRDREVEMFQVLHQHGCGPQIYCSFQNGICYQFVRGKVLDDELLRQPSIYSPSVDHELPSFETLSVEMERLRRHLSQVDSPTVLCHNDLLTKNIIYDHEDGIVKFIDFEYADYNYQAFDIGNHFNEFAGVNEVNYSLYPSLELQRDWLTSYLLSYKRSAGRPVTVTQAEVTRLLVQVCKFSLASHFLWGLWAILQSHYSSIDFDFQRYAAARLSYYFEKRDEYFGLQMNE